MPNKENTLDQQQPYFCETGLIELVRVSQISSTDSSEEGSYDPEKMARLVEAVQAVLADGSWPVSLLAEPSEEPLSQKLESGSVSLSSFPDALY